MQPREQDNPPLGHISVEGDHQVNKLLGISVVLVILLLAGCANPSVEEVNTGASTNQSNAPKNNTEISTEQTNDTQTNTPEENKTQQVFEAPGTFNLGDTVKVDNLQITLHGVREESGAELFTPKNGKYYLIELTIENVGAESETVSTMIHMKLKDADSQVYTPKIYLNAKEIVDGDLAPGQKVRGEVTFDVPDSDYYEFIYANPITSGEASWKLE